MNTTSSKDATSVATRFAHTHTLSQLIEYVATFPEDTLDSKVEMVALIEVLSKVVIDRMGWNFDKAKTTTRGSCSGPSKTLVQVVPLRKQMIRARSCSVK